VPGDCGRFNEKNEHRTSNVQHRTLNGKDEETKELINILVASIKMDEKKQK
jgi:hypothetical protein